MRFLALFLLHSASYATDYCGKADIPQYVPPSPSSNEHTSEVRSVQVFFRHGSRTDFHRTTCFPEKAQTHYSCSLSSSLSVQSDTRLVKKYKQGCQVGQLLDYASVQMTRLAEYLSKTYPRHFKNISDLFLRSTDTVRTLGSLDLLVAALFPDSRNVAIETEESDADALLMANRDCDLANKLDNDFFTSAAFHYATDKSEYFKSCARMWKTEIGTDFSLSDSPDCLFAADCAGVPYPNNLAVSKELKACVANLHSTVLQVKYGAIDSSDWTENGIRYCQLKTAPIFKDLFATLNSSSSGGLWATHDDTIACLLSGLRIWHDGVWPKYAGFVVFEFLKNNNVRVLRDGIEIALFQSLQDAVPVWMRDPQAYSDACALPRQEQSDWWWWKYSLRALGLVSLGALLIIVV